MSKMIHNPAFLTEQALVDGFVVRGRELSSVVASLRAGRHALVIGRRGMGKTTLSLRAVAEVRRDPELAERFEPVVFSEELYGVGSVGELWLTAIVQIVRDGGPDRLAEAARRLAEVRDEPELAAGALEALRSWSQQLGRRLLLVVENLDMLLGEQMGSGADEALAGALRREPTIALLATSTAPIDAVEDGPLAGVFDSLRLGPLGVAECRRLWGSLTEHEEAAGQRLEGDRIRPIHVLTGGSPRLMTIIGLQAAGRTLADLMDELLLFVDEHTSYFKSYLEALPPVERRVFAALADLWAPAGARDVGERARLDVNRTSSLLHRLAGRGAAEVVGTHGRAKSYQVADRAYNLYHLLRHGGGGAERLKRLVAFMVRFYRGELDADPVFAPIATAAAEGRLPAAQLMLEDSPAREALEPLEVALATLAGDVDAAVPAEIEAVGLDVVSWIVARRPE